MRYRFYTDTWSENKVEFAEIEAESYTEAWRKFINDLPEDLEFDSMGIVNISHEPIKCEIVRSYNEDKVEARRDRNRESTAKNPFKTIKLKPTYYSLAEPTFKFISQLLSGYIWEIEKGKTFWAMHPELENVKQLKREIDAHIRGRARIDVDAPRSASLAPMYDDDGIRLLMKFALLLPSLWD